MVSSEAPDLSAYLARLVLRSPLKEEERQAILALPASTSKKKAGASFVQSGDEIDSAYVVVSGLVSSFKQNASGARQIMALHINGDMADMPSVILAEAITGLEALTDVSLLHIPLSALTALISAYPAVGIAMWRDTAVDAAIHVEWAANIGRKSARSRLAHLFCEMAARYEQTGAQVRLSFDLPMTQEHLADATAMTAVHLNRTLMGLRSDKIVEMRNKVVRVSDWAALIEAAGFDPRYLRLKHTQPH